MAILKYRLCIFSEDPDRLANFYEKELGMKVVVRVNRPDDYGISLEASTGYKIWIAKHSHVKGKNLDPHRHMLTLYVDEISKYSDLIGKPDLLCSNIQGEERYVGSFFDPDGNCIQLMQLTGK